MGGLTFGKLDQEAKARQENFIHTMEVQFEIRDEIREELEEGMRKCREAEVEQYERMLAAQARVQEQQNRVLSDVGHLREEVKESEAKLMAALGDLAEDVKASKNAQEPTAGSTLDPALQQRGLDIVNGGAVGNVEEDMPLVVLAMNDLSKDRIPGDDNKEVKRGSLKLMEVAGGDNSMENFPQFAHILEALKVLDYSGCTNLTGQSVSEICAGTTSVAFHSLSVSE